MFDVGFSELIVIGIVALVVIGPERLPKVARTAGHLLGRLQRYVNDVKADINREMQLDELRKLQSEMRESARSLEDSLNNEIQSLGKAVESAAQPDVPVAPQTAIGDSATPLSGQDAQPLKPADSAPSTDVATGVSSASPKV